MRAGRYFTIALLASGSIAYAARAQQSSTPPQVVPPASQNPSPMVERSRRHERLQARELTGTKRIFSGPLDKPVELYLPRSVSAARPLHLVIHFLGSAFIPEIAVDDRSDNAIVAVVNIGAGSGIYDRTFRDPAAFDSLRAMIRRESAAALNAPDVSIGSLTLSGFSAGHGAIRSILRDSAHYAQVSGVLLLDGMHTSYVPENTLLEKGGILDSTNLMYFARFARDAMQGKKRFVITHSEIFPGTFASTTETADWLIAALGLERTPALEWGPRGMQQTSSVKSGGFEILGFAGNSAPDHIDQFQSLPEMLRKFDYSARR